MAENKGKSGKAKKRKVERETKVQEKKAEVIIKKSAEKFEDEFLEDDIRESAPATFNYPFLRRIPTIRVDPIATNLEIELEDIPVEKEEEENTDQYKPTPEKNYSITQKYELPGGASYDSITPKEIKAPPSPSLTPNFNDQMNAGKGFGNQNTSTPGYPGQESNERNYDSGLEQQAQSQQDKRRRDM